MTRIIGIVSGKGGVGKTTIVANLGAALASFHKKRVIIVDCNVTTSHLGLYLGMYYHPISLNQVLRGEASMDDAIYDYSIPGLKIIPASLSLDELKGTDIGELKYRIKDLFGKADIVLLDSAPGLGKEGMATIRASDEILFVTTPFVPHVMDVIKCHQIAKEVGAKSLGIVLNMSGEGRHELSPQDIEKLVELPIISTIPRDKHILRSLASKIPVVDLNPNSPASKEIKKLAAVMLGEEYKQIKPKRLARIARALRLKG
ncbi:MAG TPA: cell division ATPase MinD [archaeon]|jgi:septum site-determining protein MinD|nr:cell division ATPase MinD [archaeon]